MKKRMIAMVCIAVVCIAALSGCRCKPESKLWYVQSHQKNEVFVTGGEKLLAHTGYPSVRDPFAGMGDGFVSISFAEDGTVAFAPGTGELLTGTYTYEHNGTVDTKATVTLDNGETFTCTASSNPYGSSLMLTFREMDYLFEDIRIDPKEYYNQCLRELCASIRYWSGETEGDLPIKRCNISMVNGHYVLTAESLDSPIRLDETMAVRCFRMDQDNNLHQIDEILLGDCFYFAENAEDFLYLTFYYIDPV